MSFLHLSVLAGLAVLSVPVILHLYGQREPQLVDFPALRFVRQTTQEKASSWRLRHFLLMLLRILLLAAIVLAVARPRVHSAMLGGIIGISLVGVCAFLASIVALVAIVTNRSRGARLVASLTALLLWCITLWWGAATIAGGPSMPNTDQGSPVAAAIIFDNGPTMQYRFNNKLRMEAAQEMGEWILEQLPIESQVGIISGVPINALSLDPASAKKQLKLTQAGAARVDLLSRLRIALELVQKSELERKEIYILTDLSAVSWSGTPSELSEILTEYPDEVLVQIIDLGSVDSSNWQLGDLTCDLESVTVGTDARIQVPVVCPAGGSETENVTVELLQEEQDPRLPIIRNEKLETPQQHVVDRKVVSLQPGASSVVELTSKPLEEGTHHFEIRMSKADPLTLDNTRYLTVLANRPQPTLIVADDADLARNLQFIVNINAADNDDSAVQIIRYSQLNQVQFSLYPVICLCDPPGLSAEISAQLDQQVENGSGLLVILGSGIRSAQSIAGNPLTDLLPSKNLQLKQYPSEDTATILQVVAPSHSIFRMLGQADVPWVDFPIQRAWDLEPLVEDTQVLCRLSRDATPVLIVQQRQRGQIVTLTTPIPAPLETDSTVWNMLWSGRDPWPAWALLTGVFRTLSGTQTGHVNYLAGEPISLNNPTTKWPSRYDLFSPPAQYRRVESSAGWLGLGTVEQPGNYRLRGQLGGPVLRGFSVNASLADSQLQRIEKTQLNELLGANNFRIATNRDDVESSVGQARFGRELFPLLMLFVAGLFLAEQFMSNRFYQLKF
ncbi:MAG: BatA domain-containing protein [Planctomycetales bacterium]|nr:BatA domain-containing protein [Planctomycetales bacterium]